jgi:hypothetical protein
MATIDTGPPHYIRYPDPVCNPAAPNYNYPAEIAAMASDIADRLLRPAGYHETASSGTISTTEIQILTGFNFIIAPYYSLDPPIGYSLYADVDFSAVVATVESTATNTCGYVRVEAWDEASGLLYSASPEAWFGVAFQGQVNLSMPVRILPSSDTVSHTYNLKFFSKARLATQRHKFFEARFNTTALIPFKLEVSRFFYVPTI